MKYSLGNRNCLHFASLSFVCLLTCISSCNINFKVDDSTETDELIDGIEIGQQRIFITSTMYNGDLGGPDGADDKCQNAATAAGLKKVYKSFLSTSTTQAQNRFTMDAPLYEVDSNGTSTLVAQSLTDFQNGTVLADPAFRYDENGVDQNILLSTAAIFWIATGAGSVNFCSDWTSSGAIANGNIGSTNGSEIIGWGENQNCSIPASIICISDS